MLKAPPVYRPCPARELLVQAKKLSVGAPPVYRPCPPREAVQLKQAAAAHINVIQRAKSSNTDSRETAQTNLGTLREYRSSNMKTLERQYGNAQLDVLDALQEWGGGIIPGHGSSKGNKDSGEQPGTTRGCNSALTFLQNYLKKNRGISTDDTETDYTETNNNNNNSLYDPSLGVRKKEQKQQKKEQRQEDYVRSTCKHTKMYNGYCSTCGWQDPNYQDPYS